MTLQPADAAFEKGLRDRLPETIFRPFEGRYREEPRGKFSASDAILLAPRTVDEVSVILKSAHEAHVPVVPFGGGTGLVGGQVYDGVKPVVVTLERMNKIRAVYPAENVLIAEAGAILHSVKEAAYEAGRLFPLSLASEGSCQIGGNLATNAGGVNVLRYGNTRDLCLGVEAVLPDGTIINALRRVRKDNTGYDLRNLLVGSEGSLGIITAASLKLFDIPAQSGTALFAVTSPDAALAMLNASQALTGGGVSAFELIHETGFAFLAEHFPELKQPFAPCPEWMALVELGVPNCQNPTEIFETIFENALEDDLCFDGVIAQSEAQAQTLWALREHIPHANRSVGAVASHDVSLPLSEISKFVEAAKREIAEMSDMRVNCFGHLGDGNLHFNLFPAVGKTKADYQNIAAEAQKIIHDLVHHFDGSFSAEHGVGRLKVAELATYGDDGKLMAKRAIKGALDPHGIMNPGVFF
ncbi:MAG: FAD-binding oxidoreductase [Halocynthiibacter sp.]